VVKSKNINGGFKSKLNTVQKYFTTENIGCEKRFGIKFIGNT